MQLVNPFDQPGKWYKANFHTHTTTSDGRVSPPDRCEEYRRAGYHVLALTDHRKTNDVSGFSRKNFLVVSGMEYHPRCPNSPDPYHMVAVNVPLGFTLDESALDANACIAAVKKAGGETILAHPLWCGQRYDQYSHLRGYVALEVFNSTCDKIGRSTSEGDWCHHCDDGRIIPAVAVDDAHCDDAFEGWTWLRLPELTVPAVLHALRTGCGFSSSGPKIHDFGIRDGKVVVRCSPAVSVHLVANTCRGSRRRAEPGKLLRGAEFPVGKDWRYIRAVVTDERGHKAWANPIILQP